MLMYCVLSVISWAPLLKTIRCPERERDPFTPTIYSTGGVKQTSVAKKSLKDKIWHQVNNYCYFFKVPQLYGTAKLKTLEYILTPPSIFPLRLSQFHDQI